MQTVWLRADSTVGDREPRMELVRAAIDAGVDWVLVDDTDVDAVPRHNAVSVATFRTAGDVSLIDEAETEDDRPEITDLPVVGKNGEGDGTVDVPEDFAGSADLSTLRGADGPVAGYVAVDSADRRRLARAVADETTHAILATPDREIAPLADLVADATDTAVVVAVGSPDVAADAFETPGIDGVLLETGDLGVVHETLRRRDDIGRTRLDVTTGEVVAVDPGTTADVVSVDTATLLDDDEGLLVGGTTDALALVRGDGRRPFRVPAGPVHAYVHTPNGLAYLADIEGGDAISIVDGEGAVREGTVGRVRIERRATVRVRIATDDGERTLLTGGDDAARVVTTGGTVPAAELTVGDTVSLVAAGSTTADRRVLAER